MATSNARPAIGWRPARLLLAVALGSMALVLASAPALAVTPHAVKFTAFPQLQQQVGSGSSVSLNYNFIGLKAWAASGLGNSSGAGAAINSSSLKYGGASGAPVIVSARLSGTYTTVCSASTVGVGQTETGVQVVLVDLTAQQSVASKVFDVQARQCGGFMTVRTPDYSVVGKMLTGSYAFQVGASAIVKGHTYRIVIGGIAVAGGWGVFSSTAEMILTNFSGALIY